MVLAEADGAAAETARVAARAARGARRGRARAARAATPGEVAALWRWRDGISIAVDRAARRQGPRTSPSRSNGSPRRSTGTRGDRRPPRLEAVSWGHAGDGNLHSTFLSTRRHGRARARGGRGRRAVRAGARARRHHLRRARARLGQARPPGAQRARRHWLQRAIKRAFDPGGCSIPGKSSRLPRWQARRCGRSGGGSSGATSRRRSSASASTTVITPRSRDPQAAPRAAALREVRQHAHRYGRADRAAARRATHVDGGGGAGARRSAGVSAASHPTTRSTSSRATWAANDVSARNLHFSDGQWLRGEGLRHVLPALAADRSGRGARRLADELPGYRSTLER